MLNKITNQYIQQQALFLKRSSNIVYIQALNINVSLHFVCIDVPRAGLKLTYHIIDNHKAGG